MRYLSDPLFCLYFLIGIALPTGLAILMVFFGFDKTSQNPWEPKRVFFICAFLAAMWGCIYLAGEQHQSAFCFGLFPGLVVFFWILLASNSAFFNPFRWRAWKVAFIRALAAEGKTPHDFAIAVLPAAILAILIIAQLFIVHEIRVFNR